MKFGITARMAVLASGLVLIMTGITGWVFYGKASQVLTNQELERLEDNTSKVGYALATDIGQLRRDAWILAQEEKEKAVSYQLLHALHKEKGNADTLEAKAQVAEMEK